MDLLVAGGLWRLQNQLLGMDPVPFRFGEEEEQSNKDGAVEGDVQPPEIAPVGMLSHGSGDDGADLGFCH